jgi:hypothetical protein
MFRILFIFFFLLTSCSQISSDKRNKLIQELNSNQFNSKIYSTKFFNIFSLQKISNNQKLIIYVEGDGLAWIDMFTKSSDPTPGDPLAFKLALIDHNENVIYLARPCQYEWSVNCNQDTWTSAQYSSTVLNSYKEIINSLSRNYKEIHLVGYSGGAGIVMYLGSLGNKNIKSIRTIAGNINHNQLTKILNISKLKKSINFDIIEKKNTSIPQLHYYGLKDKVVPNELQIFYKKRNINNNCINIQSVSDVSHNNGWLEYWKLNNINLPNCI